MKELECTDFIAKVPVTFDETVPLDGKVGEYVGLARRKGDEWFAGAMTNWTARELQVDVSFLGDGEYELESYGDGANANRFGNDYAKGKTLIHRNEMTKIKLAEGGGWAAHIRLKN